MRSRRNEPLKINWNNTEERLKQVDPYADVQLSRVLKDLSFMRIQLDEIVFPESNEFIERLCRNKQLFGFQLEYSFPCLQKVSKALCGTVRIPEKLATPTKIEFKHKRVVLLEMHADQVEMWQKSKLHLHLMVNMNSFGKYTMRPIAKAIIPLNELLVAPFMISRDFAFIGQEFQGTALIRIDLGSRSKPLMEKIESLRADIVDETFVVARRTPGRRMRSRSSSRCTSHHSTRSNEENITPAMFTRSLELESPRPSTSEGRRNGSACPSIGRRNGSVSSIGSDSVFIGGEHVSEELEYHGGKCRLQLTVHEARGLPPIQDESGRIVPPNVFISILGREGELRSVVQPSTRRPVWNWTALFTISAERRNLVVKLVHRGSMGDTPLGFVTLALPIETCRRAVFEITDVSRMNKFSTDAPILIMSIDTRRDSPPIETVSARSSSSSLRTSPRRFANQSTQSSPNTYRDNLIETPIMETREEIIEKLRRNMEELGAMMQGMSQ